MEESLERRSKLRELVVAGLAEPTSHGPTGYEQGCRCEDCRQGNADRHRRKRKRRVRRTPFELIPHGADGYTNYECRCEKCTMEHRLERQKEREQARKAA